MNEKINIALNEISEKHIAQAAKKPHNKKLTFFGAIAAVLAVVLLLNSGIKMPITAKAVALAATPRIGQRPDIGDYPDRDAWRADLDLWEAERTERLNNVKNALSSGLSYYQNTNQAFLGNANGTNQVWSPVNGYISLAILAETTGGETRQEILNLLGVDSLETLREEVSSLWESVYRDNGKEICVLANSLWLDEAFSFKKPTVQLLADRYYASSFHGDLGTEKLDKQLQAWLNTNTGDLLKDQVENVKMDPQTVFALASTVNFAAGWNKKFSEGNTKNAVFHALNGDITTPFMNKTILSHTYYRGKNFGAIALELTGSNRMWLILPDEGYTTADILASEEYLRMTLDPGSWESKGAYTLHLSLPKFDVVNQTDLTEGIKAMGVTDIFDRTVSNFTPITDTPMLAVNGINHAARVSIDEDGCVAAAFTVITPPGGGPPPDIDKLDFVLDRPFLFVVSGRDNLPLFAGVVNEP